MSARIIVIVEDDVDLLEGWKDLFEFSGYEVHGFPSAGAALDERDALSRADVLITDYHLADLNGVELIRQARQISPGLPALVLTGLKQEHVSEFINAEPDVTLFYKPTGIDEIERHVEELFAQKS